MSITRRLFLHNAAALPLGAATIPAFELAAIVPASAVVMPVIDRKARIKEMIYDLEGLLAEETGQAWKTLLLTSPSDLKDIVCLGTTPTGFNDPFGIVGQPMHFGRPVEGDQA